MKALKIDGLRYIKLFFLKIITFIIDKAERKCYTLNKDTKNAP